MKNLIFIIFMAAVCTFAAASLDHIPRPGDRLRIVEASSQKDVFLSDADTIDFSCIKPTQNVTYTFDNKNEVKGSKSLCGLSHRSVQSFATDSDGVIYLSKVGKPGQAIDYDVDNRIPIINLSDKKLSGAYFGRGSISDVDLFTEYGRFQTSVPSKCAIITLEGDTIDDCSLCRVSYTGVIAVDSDTTCTYKFPPFENTVAVIDSVSNRYLGLKFKGISTDSIMAALYEYPIDSIRHSVEMAIVLADGLRYPVARQSINRIFLNNAMVDSITELLYYPISYQLEDIDEQPENRQMKKQRAASDILASASETEFLTGFDISPTLVTYGTTITLKSPVDTEAIITVMSTDGIVYETSAYKVIAPIDSIHLDLSSLPKGYYIISCQMGASVYSEKILRL